MKKNVCVILAIVILILIVILICTLVRRSKCVEIGEIERMYFVYTTGNMAHSSVVYELDCEDGVYTASVKPDGVPEEESLHFGVDAGFVRRLEALLRENEVGRWDGFRKSDKRVLDGKHFEMSLTMADGTVLHASGYMKWPKNYSAVRDGIKALFGELSA